MRVRLALPFVALGLTAMSACSSTADQQVAVTGTDDACTPAKTDLTAGKVTFVFTNRAKQVNELYVLTPDKGVVGEIENVTTGTKRNLTVSLRAGDYLLTCKPGQQGEGITTPITAAGGGGGDALVATTERKVTAKDYAFDVPATTLKAGAVVRFELANQGTVEHEMEVFGPDGKAIGEVGPTKPGEDGSVVLRLDRDGTYRLVCGLQDHEKRGMVADLVVASA